LRRSRLIAKGDPDREQICATIRARIAAVPAGSVVLAEDETHLDFLAPVRACWIPRGMRSLLPTPGSNQRRTVFGAVNLATGAFRYHLAVKGVSVVFCYFLDLLLRPAVVVAPRQAAEREGSRYLVEISGTLTFLSGQTLGTAGYRRGVTSVW
jgi:hypothetical protein